MLPLPLLGLALTYLLFPGPSRASFAAELAAVTEHPARMALIGWLEVPFFVGMVPACLGVAWLCRRRAPVLATLGGTLTAVGFGAGFALLPGGDLAAALASGVDPAALERVEDASWAAPRAELGIVLFLLGGVMIGLALLGLGLWRSHTAPVWAGIALIIAGPTHPFMPNTTVSGLGLLLGAAGFAGAKLVPAAQRQRGAGPAAGSALKDAVQILRRSPVSPSLPPLPMYNGGRDGFSCTPRSRSFKPPGTVRM